MITVVVKSGYDGQVYRIDTDDRDQAAAWLLNIALEFGPNQGGIYAPMTIDKCAEWTQ